MKTNEGQKRKLPNFCFRKSDTTTLNSPHESFFTRRFHQNKTGRMSFFPPVSCMFSKIAFFSHIISGGSPSAWRHPRRNREDAISPLPHPPLPHPSVSRHGNRDMFRLPYDVAQRPPQTFPSQSSSMTASCDFASRAPRRGSRDIHTALNWLRWLLASSTVHRETKQATSPFLRRGKETKRGEGGAVSSSSPSCGAVPRLAPHQTRGPRIGSRRVVLPRRV